MDSKTYTFGKPKNQIRFIALWEQEKRLPFLDDSIRDWMDLMRRLEEKGHILIKYTNSRAIFFKLTDQGYEFASNLIP